MLMIVGLGNPGPKYSETRHNVGFMVLDQLVDQAGGTFKDSKWEAQLVKTRLGSQEVLFVKPMTFMNLSGKSVRAIASYFQIEPEEIVVIHDDLDLEVGRLKMVYDRGAGGHNGIKSIIEHLGTREFVRFRMGIGRPPEQVPPASFVLSKFAEAELAAVKQVFPDIVKGLEMISSDSVSGAMNFINSKRGE
jgi:PTH1 family peptidyl-tRNA hydrolase